MLRAIDEIEDTPEPWNKLLTWAHTRKKSEYPWEKMGIGDVFRFGNIEEKTARSNASRASKKWHKRFKVVKIGVKLYCFRVDDEWAAKLDAMRETKYPWRTVEVGGRFRMDDVEPHSRRTMAKAASVRYDKEFVVEGRMIRRVK